MASKAPPLPSHWKDNPVGQVRRFREAAGKVKKHTRGVKDWLIQQVDNMPVEKVEVSVNSGERYHINETRYEYLIDPAELRRIIETLQARIGEAPSQAVVSAAVQAYTEGTGIAVEALRGLSDAYNAELVSVLASDPWQRRVALIEARVFESMEGFQGETGRDLARTLREAVEVGRNPMELKKTIRERFSVSDTRAERIARTEVTSAYRRARLDEAEDARERLGIRTMMLHMSALLPTTRDHHAARHGNLYTPQEAREWWASGANSINCYLPGTRVRGRFVAGSKASYDGMAIRLVTASGRDISVTPNHPVMTDRGLVAAGEITERDNLISYSGEADNTAGVGTLNGELMDARIEDVFCSLVKLGHSFSPRVGAVDFHGDGEFIKEDVEIVDVERPLIVGGNAARFEFLDDIKLVFPDSVKRPSLGSKALGALAVNLTPPGLMSLFHTLSPKFGGKLCRRDKACLAAVSPLKTGFFKPSIEGDSGHSGFLAYLKDRLPFNVLPMQLADVESIPQGRALDPMLPDELLNVVGGHSERRTDDTGRLPGEVFLDDVVSVERFPYSGHVYDLQEASGLMVAGEVISSNCRCSVSEILVDEDGEPTTPKLVERVRAIK